MVLLLDGISAILMYPFSTCALLSCQSSCQSICQSSCQKNCPLYLSVALSSLVRSKRRGVGERRRRTSQAEKQPSHCTSL